MLTVKCWLQKYFANSIEIENRPTGGVALHSIGRERFLPPNIYNH